jgi:Fumarylacetoacetate (FAA) hydrolase family
MFHPNDSPLERGWVGRIDGDRMRHLAAQTLQSLFLNGLNAREHAEYPLAEVTLLVPVQYPPTVRVFARDGSFRFANATAVVGDTAPVSGGGPLRALARIAGVIGAGGEIGGYSALLEWVDPTARPEVKQSDFGLVLGPTVVTPDELDPSSAGVRLRGDGEEVTGAPDGFSWGEAVAVAGRRTTLRPGDVLAGPPVLELEATSGAELEVDGVGTLRAPLA